MSVELDGVMEGSAILEPKLELNPESDIDEDVEQLKLKWTSKERSIKVEVMDNHDAPTTSFTHGQSLNYTVWIIGDSYVKQGAHRAAETKQSNLSLPGVRVCWFGMSGLQWKGLLPFFSNSLRGKAAPEVLVIHCGANDMGEVRSVQLVNVMKQDLQKLQLCHPGMKIMFSAVTQRCRWKANVNPVKIDKARKFVNSVMATFVQSINGTMIEHPYIRHDSPGLFLKDGVNFTPRGIDIFISSIANCLKDHIKMQ